MFYGFGGLFDYLVSFDSFLCLVCVCVVIVIRLVLFFRSLLYCVVKCMFTVMGYL